MPGSGGDAEDRSSRPNAGRNVAIFLSARFAAATAWQMQGVAIGWYVYALTNSAFALGLIGLVQFLPMAGLAVPAGHVVDRQARRPVAMLAYAIEGLSSLALALMTMLGSGDVGAVFLAIACYGVGRAFEQPSMQSWLPSLVPAASYPRAAAANSLASQTAVVLGPTVGGLLYLAGPTIPFLCAGALQAAAFAAAFALPRQSRAGLAATSWGEALDGVRFIRRSELVLGVITLDLLCVLFGGATALMPVFARDILAVGPAGLGLLRSAPALGAFLTGIVLTHRPPRRRIGPQLLATIAIYGAATVGFGLSRNFALSVASLMLAGGADMLSVVIRQTMIQIVAPDAIRGRVTAVASLFTGASNQLGQFESGVTAAWFGPVASVVLGGIATLGIVALWMRRFPALSHLDRLSPPP